MFLLVTRTTKVDEGSTLDKGLVLAVAHDCHPEWFSVRIVSTLEKEPPPFSVNEDVDLTFAHRIYPNILEYTTWDALRAAANMCLRPRQRRRA